MPSSEDALFQSIAETFQGDRRVTQSKMFGSQGLKVGGKVFAMLFRGRLVVKLPRERVEGLVASGDGKPFDPGHGRIMKEWVSVAPNTKRQWLDLVNEAKDFVRRGK